MSYHGGGRGTFLSDLRHRKERLNRDFMNGCWEKPELNEIMKNIVHAENDYRAVPGRMFVNDRNEDTGLGNYSMIDAVMPPFAKKIMDSFIGSGDIEHFDCPQCEKYYYDMKKYKNLLFLAIGLFFIIWGFNNE